jgi:hypothetical protein
MLKVNGDKGEWVATAQKPCYGSAAASSSYARRDLLYAFTELLRGVDVCLILDQFGELITCPIQEGDGAKRDYQRMAASVLACRRICVMQPKTAHGSLRA